MSPAIRYADTLRAIGQALDMDDARGLRITEDEAYLTVSWQDGAGHWENRMYHKGAETDRLAAEARRERAHRSKGENRWEEPLRTLGQELDAQGMQLTRLAAAHGFELTGTIGGKEVARLYAADELQYKSGQRRVSRGASGGARSTRWWRRLLPRGGG